MVYIYSLLVWKDTLSAFEVTVGTALAQVNDVGTAVHRYLRESVGLRLQAP